jgi:hypothetical protein
MLANQGSTAYINSVCASQEARCISVFWPGTLTLDQGGGLVKVKVMLRLTVSQSVCLGVGFTLELVTRYYFLSENCRVVSMRRPL